MKQNNNAYRINAVEFISSWEKKWAELTKLDFFIYQAINRLSSELGNYFSWEDPDDNEDLRFLSFLLGDRLEDFLLVECFGDCPLQCPLDLKKIYKSSEIYEPYHGLRKKKRRLSANKKKSGFELLSLHIRNEVVRPTLIDFLRFDDNQLIFKSHTSLRKLIYNATDIIVGFIRSSLGQELLKNRAQHAGEYFAEVLKEENKEQLSYFDFDDYENIDNMIDDLYTELIEEDEKEAWQIHPLKLNQYIEEFILDKETRLVRFGNDELREVMEDLNVFNEFITEYTNVSEVGEINVSVLREFFSFYLPYIFEFYEYGRIPKISQHLKFFLEWMLLKGDLSRRLPLLVSERATVQYNRILKIAGYMASERSNASLFSSLKDITTYSGFYEVIRRKESHISLRSANTPFQIEVITPRRAGRFFRKNDILDAVIVKNEKGKYMLWEVNHFYTAFAHTFLFGDYEEDY